MKQATIIVSAVAAAAAAAGLVSAATGAQAPTGQTITLRELAKGKTARVVDLPPLVRDRRNPILSAGDVVMSNWGLADSSGKNVGTLEIDCTVTRPKNPHIRGARTLCEGAFNLNDGVLFGYTLQELCQARCRPGVSYGPDGRGPTGAIIGGTGRYAGARGTFASQLTSKGDAVDIITLLP
jgi:hypothetical protein